MNTILLIVLQLVVDPCSLLDLHFLAYLCLGNCFAHHAIDALAHVQKGQQMYAMPDQRGRYFGKVLCHLQGSGQLTGFLGNRRPIENDRAPKALGDTRCN